MEIYIKSPFSMTRHQVSEKKKRENQLAYYCKEYMYEVELFHQSSSKILQNVCVWTVRQCRSRSDLVDIVCQTYNFKLAVFRF